MNQSQGASGGRNPHAKFECEFSPSLRVAPETLYVPNAIWKEAKTASGLPFLKFKICVAHFRCASAGFCAHFLLQEWKTLTPTPSTPRPSPPARFAGRGGRGRQLLSPFRHLQLPILGRGAIGAVYVALGWYVSPPVALWLAAVAPH